MLVTVAGVVPAGTWLGGKIAVAAPEAGRSVVCAHVAVELAPSSTGAPVPVNGTP